MLKKMKPVNQILRGFALCFAVLMMMSVLSGIQPIQVEAASATEIDPWASIIEIEAGQKFYAGDLITYNSLTVDIYKTLSMVNGVTYTSSKTSVATIGRTTGLVTAKKAGTTTITAAYKSQKVTFKLKVVKKGSLGTTTTYKSLNKKAAKIQSYFSKNPATAIKYAFAVRKMLKKYDVFITEDGDVSNGCASANDGTLILYVPLCTRIETLSAMYDPLAIASAKAFQASKMTASVSKNTLTLKLKSKVTSEQVLWLRYAFTQASSSKTCFTGTVWDRTADVYYDAKVYVTAGSKTLTIKLYSSGKRVKIVKGHKYQIEMNVLNNIISSKAV